MADLTADGQALLAQFLCSIDIAHAVARMLETVPTAAGTGSRARVANYRIAGKTGTSHKANASGYAAARYVSSFAGFGPASNPQLVCVVIINDPSGKDYYGGLVAAPLFSEVMTGAMRILNIPPDDYPAMLVAAADHATPDNATLDNAAPEDAGSTDFD